MIVIVFADGGDRYLSSGLYRSATGRRTMGTGVVFGPGAVAELRRLAVAAYPSEGCGVLVGDVARLMVVP